MQTMCDAFVINSVKDRMISRRDLFGTVAAGAAVAAVGATAAAPAGGQWRDRGHDPRAAREFPDLFR